jgi:hydrogenase-4 component F
MQLSLMLFMPVVGAIIAWFLPDNHRRPLVLPFFAVIHLALLSWVLVDTPPASAGGWFLLDPIGKLVMFSFSILFAACAWYAVNYLRYREDRSNRILCSALLLCLSAMCLVSISQNLGVLWVALETTSILMAPLIYFNHNARSLEATWKYFLICSVGIAVALLGIFFLAYSTIVAHQDATLLLSSLIEDAPRLNPQWRHTAFIFLLVGFGSKMGLAPMHTWKPDAYGEAPGIVGALLAGGLVNCAFLSLMRVYQIAVATQEAATFQNALIVMGLLSMAFAAVFMARQNDFKRMLAYSSVEHVGILTLALGLGKGALLGALFHMVNNCLTKGVLFLSAGNIHRAFGSKNTAVVRGAIRWVPWSGALFLTGFLAITGSPPFAPFVSEFTIVSSAFTTGNYWAGSLFLVFLAAIFIGMALTVLPVVLGEPPELEAGAAEPDRDSFVSIMPLLVLMAIMLVFGIWVPPPLRELLTAGARLLGGYR